ncbi:DUF2637 domain-containing protein [Streptomyces sp. NPDC002490]|uniref:DUF2637 domain-containing protein n=1 Tax=Streptomyces sp. NPDC002490 TaxID=3154416 RepID=UPI00332E2914
MHSPAPITPTAIRGSRTIRLGIVLLATVGFALSYDALRHMAVAIHIRGPLTYLFPLVIDGFIAIGVVALLILRTAPLRSRLYVWALVGQATVTSIWANALHAIRLNEETRLYLDNATVGALSAIAPLALAGAVHLYLVINRHLSADKAVTAETPSATRPATTAMPRPSRPIRQRPAQDVSTAPSAKSGEPAPDAQSAKGTHSATTAALRKGGRRATVPDDVLLATARALGAQTGKVPRTALENAVRQKGYTIRKDLAQEAADTVTAELADPTATAAAA